MIFAEQGQWADPVRAGLQAAQPPGDRLLWTGVQQQQGSHGTVTSASLHQQGSVLRICQLNFIREAIFFNFTRGNGQLVSQWTLQM